MTGWHRGEDGYAYGYEVLYVNGFPILFRKVIERREPQ